MGKKTLWDRIKTTIYGGIIFLIPFTVILIVLDKIIGKINASISPLVEKAGVEGFWGAFTVTIFSILIILIICFIAGLIIKLNFTQKFHNKLDNLAIQFIPGYDKLKSEALKKVDTKFGKSEGNIYDSWKAVLLKEENKWSIAFVIDEDKNGFVTLFFPDSPNPMTGKVKIIPMVLKDAVEKNEIIQIDTSKAFSVMKNYGKDAAEYLYKSN